MVLAEVSTGKLQIRMLWLSSFSIWQFDWLGFLSIVCELSTKIGIVRDPSECADGSKVATRCRSDACGSYRNPESDSQPFIHVGGYSTLVQLEPARQRYVASRRANRLTDWAMCRHTISICCFSFKWVLPTELCVGTQFPYAAFHSNKSDQNHWIIQKYMEHFLFSILQKLHHPKGCWSSHNKRGCQNEQFPYCNRMWITRFARSFHENYYFESFSLSLDRLANLSNDILSVFWLIICSLVAYYFVLIIGYPFFENVKLRKNQLDTVHEIQSEKISFENNGHMKKDRVLTCKGPIHLPLLVPLQFISHFWDYS